MIYVVRLGNGLIGAVAEVDDNKEFVLKPENYESDTCDDLP